MKFNRHYWLEIAETLALFLVGLGAIITLVSNNLIFVVIPMVATLIFNQINRRKKEQQIYHKTLGKLEQLQSQVWDELQSLHELIETLQESDKKETEFINKSNEIPKINNQQYINEEEKVNPLIAEEYEEYILSLEESLNHVIQYLNQAGINQRFQQLEEGYEQITSDVSLLTRKLNFTNETVSQKNTSSSSLLLFGPENKIEENSEQDNDSEAEITENIEENTIPEVVNTRTKNIKVENVSSLPTKWLKKHELVAHENSITDLVISRDSYFVGTVSLDQNLKIWSLETGKLIHSNIAHEKGILALACKQKYVEDSKNFEYVLATGGFDYNIKIWKFITNKTETFNITSTHTLSGHLGSIRALKITPDNSLLVSGSYDKTLKQWTISDGSLIQTSYDDLSSIQSIAVSYDGQIIASGGEDGKIHFWEAKTGIKRGSLTGNEDSVKYLDFSGDGQLLGAGCDDGTIKLWQLEASIFRDGVQPLPTSVLSEHNGEIKSIIFSNCGEYLMSADTYGKILIWSIDSGEIMETLNISQDSEDEETRLLSLALSEDGNFLVAGDVKGKITIWEKNIN